MWRGVFYTDVIQGKGSEFQSQVVMKKTLEALPKLATQLLGLIPEVGHLFAAVEIFETLRELHKARCKVDEHFNDLIDTIISVEDYVFKYVEALMSWNRRATSLVFLVKGSFELHTGLLSGTDINILKSRVESLYAQANLANDEMPNA